MANTNWSIGIDKGSSTPGGTQVALLGFVFLDTSFVGVSDGSPDAPYKTLPDAITNSGANGTIVIADGTYIITANGAVATTGLKFLANKDKGVSIVSDDPATVRILVDNDALNYRFIGIKFVSVVPPRLNIDLRECTFDQSGWSGNVAAGAASGVVNIDNCVFIDTDLTIAGRAGFEVELGHDINKCTFTGASNKIEVQASNVNNYTLNITNCDFETNFDIEHNDSLNIGSSNFSNSNFRGTITNIDAGSVLPEDSTNINQDPKWVGDPSNYEFLIQSTSPLIGAGRNNSTIGAFNLGQLVDFTGATNNNIDLGPPIVLTADNDQGDITPQIITFDQIRKSPIPCFNGIEDGKDNILKLNYDKYFPDGRRVSILYRETVGGADNTKVFRYGLPMFLDNSGRSTGELDFDPYDISSTGDILNNPDLLTAPNIINVAQYQPSYSMLDLIEFNHFAVDLPSSGDRLIHSKAATSTPTNYTQITWFWPTVDPPGFGAGGGDNVLTGFSTMGAGSSNWVGLTKLWTQGANYAISVGHGSVAIPGTPFPKTSLPVMCAIRKTSGGNLELRIYHENGITTASIPVVTEPPTYDQIVAGSTSLGVNTKILEYRFVKSVVNNADLLTHFNEGYGNYNLDSLTMEAWYKMKEGSGTNVADESGNNFDLSFLGSPAWIAFP